MFQHFKCVDSSIEIHDFAPHSYEHSSQENPHFLFHFLSLHQWRMKIYFLKLYCLFGKPSFLKISSHIRIRQLSNYNLLYPLTVEVRQFLATLKAIVLIPWDCGQLFF